PQRSWDRLPVAAVPDGGNQGRRPRRHLVEEEVLFGRKVVVDGLFGDVRRDGHLSYGDSVEPALGEELHRAIRDLPPGSQLLGLAQTHVIIVTRSSFAEKFPFL